MWRQVLRYTEVYVGLGAGLLLGAYIYVPAFVTDPTIVLTAVADFAVMFLAILIVAALGWLGAKILEFVAPKFPFFQRLVLLLFHVNREHIEHIFSHSETATPEERHAREAKIVRWYHILIIIFGLLFVAHLVDSFKFYAELLSSIPYVDDLFKLAAPFALLLVVTILSFGIVVSLCTLAIKKLVPHYTDYVIAMLRFGAYLGVTLFIGRRWAIGLTIIGLIVFTELISPLYDYRLVFNIVMAIECAAFLIWLFLPLIGELLLTTAILINGHIVASIFLSPTGMMGDSAFDTVFAGLIWSYWLASPNVPPLGNWWRPVVWIGAAFVLTRAFFMIKVA
jgi:hypothetical protein